MKKTFLIPGLALLLMACNPTSNTTNDHKEEKVTLKDAFKDKFLIGAAINVDQIMGVDTLGAKIVEEQFNSIVAENCMKSMYLQPEEGKFDFKEADRFVAFGEKNNMAIIGHTLVWQNQAPDWFFVDENGKDVSREVLIERMKNHITTVVKHYKGAIKGWDVVNEAILDDGSWRKSKLYEIIGEDFISLAFKFAHEADPNAELYYNDFSMGFEGRRESVIKLVKNLQSQGIRIDGVGMQGHMSLDFPDLNDWEKSIIAFSELGVKVMITELDLSIIPSPTESYAANIDRNYAYGEELNPYKNGITEEGYAAFEKRYLDIFKLLLKHQDKIDRVTLWGVSDLTTWRNDWPVNGRTDYPLLFDREYKAKPLVEKLIKLAEEDTASKLKQ